MRTFSFTTTVSMVSIAAVLSACQFEPSLESSRNSQKERQRVGKVKVLAGAIHHPEDWISSAKIKVVNVQIRKVDSTYLTFLEEPFELSLTELASGVEPVLSRARVPDGFYDSIRLVTEDAGEIILNDGSVHPLVVPSGSKTGIKVFFDQPVSVENGVIQKFTMKFDLSRSFVATPQAFLFKPVVHIEVDQYVDPNPDGSTETPPGDGSGDSTDGSGDGTDGSGDSTDTTNPPADGGDGDYPVIGA